ncbi:MAG: PAS domain S-box protein [Pararhizobium sp.]
MSDRNPSSSVSERQAFLLKLSDALRPLADPVEALEVASRLTAEHLDVGRVTYCEVRYEPDVTVIVPRDWPRHDMPSIAAGRYRMDDFGPFQTQELTAGRPAIVSDAATDPRPSPVELQSWREVDIVSSCALPVMKNGVFVAYLVAQDNRPHDWTESEVALLTEVSERVWASVERARAEAALQASEARYRTLFETIDEGFVTLEVLYDNDGEAVDWRYLEANQAYIRQSGLRDPSGMLGSEYTPNAEPTWLETFLTILRTGEPIRLEQFHEDSGHWYDAYLTRIGDGSSRQIASVFNDITERKEREGRQAFLLKLSDALRAEPDADAVANRALHMFSEQLGLDRAYIASYRLADDRADITHQVGNDRTPAMPAAIRLSDFPAAFRRVFDQTLIIEDVAETEGLSETDKANMNALGFRALIAATLRKGENSPHWVIVAVSARSRCWTPGEIALAEEVAERTWAAMERTRAEAALRESEARFQQFADASSGALWIRDAETLEMEFVSPAIRTIYGVEPEALLGGIKQWAAMIVPEDRETALQHMEQARHGEPAVHEFRIKRGDGTFRWIKNTDFPLHDHEGNVERVGGIADDVTDTKLLTEHQGVLLHELQHRVRNIMGIIRSIGNRSADGAASTEDYRRTLEGRMLALARVQALLTREANVGGSLRNIIESEVQVQAHHPHQFELVGPDIMLSPKAVEVLTLAFHELSTNALKYGAFSAPEGRLTVSWAPFEKRGNPWLGIDWAEKGAPPRKPSKRRGFGSELIEARIPYELGGTGKVIIDSGGASCRIEFPLKNAESILETDAPMPTTTFGGTIDMSGAPDLTGRTVLVVEDDYYMAADTVAALRGAGAEVLGPCPGEEATRDLLETEHPTHAVLDLNLGGGGPKFEIARLLRAKGIPFVFITGYDPDVIPPELVDVPRLQKPLPFRAIVEAVSLL